MPDRFIVADETQGPTLFQDVCQKFLVPRLRGALLP